MTEQGSLPFPTAMSATTDEGLKALVVHSSVLSQRAEAFAELERRQAKSDGTQTGDAKEELIGLVEELSAALDNCQDDLSTIVAKIRGL